MSELIRSSSPIHKKLLELISEACKHTEVEARLSFMIGINVDPDDMPDDMEAAVELCKEGEEVHIFDDGNQKWLIPATDEEDVLKKVQAIIDNKLPSEDEKPGILVIVVDSFMESEIADCNTYKMTDKQYNNFVSHKRQDGRNTGGSDEDTPEVETPTNEKLAVDRIAIVRAYYGSRYVCMVTPTRKL